MSQPLKMCLCLLTLSPFWTACGVLFPETDRPPVVLTKTEMHEMPILIDPTCPPKPQPPKKPGGHNTLSKDAAEFFAALDGWAMACADLNEAIEQLLRPSQPAGSTPPNSP